jgi:hypothetical protein
MTQLSCNLARDLVALPTIAPQNASKT